MNLRYILLSICLLLLMACSEPEKQPEDKTSTSDLLRQENLLAWCIVPFDSKERGPVERVSMLKELGFRGFAYDWREKHLDSFPEEVEALKQAGIRLESVWFWVANADEAIDANNARLLAMVKELGLKTEFWVCLNPGMFQELNDEESLKLSADLIKVYQEKAKELGCTISLYNHGDWFGDPRNQIRIIKALGDKDIGIVYNFHHAHHEIDQLPELLSSMMPYLRTVNLNGMNRGGPKILPIGKGEEEAGMIQQLRESGFQGKIGILGHVDTADVQLVLQGNLEGLKQFQASSD